ncbi:MAG: tripartite tricarboxylate transporter TctB family protein [Beijerinckiaceae bacterium]
MPIRHPDIVTAAILIAIGAAMYALSNNIYVTPSISTFSPRFFPKLASVCIVLCGIGVLVGGLLAERKEMPFLFNKTNLIVAALFLIYFLSFEQVDFRAGSWALILACMYVLGCRSKLQLAIVPVVTATAIYLVFTYGFEVVLPQWI